MKAAILLVLSLFYMCEDLNEESSETRWYIQNESTSMLYFYSRVSDMQEIHTKTNNGKTEIIKTSDWIRKDFEFFKYNFYGNALYDEIVLIDSLQNPIRKWTIHDEDIDEHHIMNEDAWECKKYEINGVTHTEWTYTITAEYLEYLKNH